MTTIDEASINALLPAGVGTAPEMLRQGGSVNKWILTDPGKRIGAACWNLKKDLKLIYRELPEVSLTYHVSGSTRVSLYKDGRRVAHGAHVGGISVNVPGTCEWELRGNMEFMHLYLPPQTLRNYSEAHLSANRREYVFRPLFSVSDPWLSGFFTMLQSDASLGRRHDSHSLLLDSLLNHLLEHLFSMYAGATPAHDVQPAAQSRRALSGALLKKLEDYLVAHLSHNVSLADLANIANLSEGHFLRAYRDSTGITPYQHLTALRMQRARQRLETDSTSITELAQSLGYASVSHFSEQFRKKVGVTPSMYRHLQRPSS